MNNIVPISVSKKTPRRYIYYSEFEKILNELKLIKLEIEVLKHRPQPIQSKEEDWFKPSYVEMTLDRRNQSNEGKKYVMKTIQKDRPDKTDKQIYNRMSAERRKANQG